MPNTRIALLISLVNVIMHTELAIYCSRAQVFNEFLID